MRAMLRYIYGKPEGSQGARVIKILSPTFRVILVSHTCTEMYELAVFSYIRYIH